MSLAISLREHTARIVRDFVACGPKGACSRMTVLALTALGIVATGGAGNVAALLSGFGINVGASALFEFLRKLSDKGPFGPTLEDTLAAVQALSAQEQNVLQQVADGVDVMPLLLSEALAQHRHELLADFGGLLTTWSSTLPFAKIEVMLDRIGAETAGLSPIQADLLALKDQLRALRSGLHQDVNISLVPLTAEVQALRARLDALLAQIAAGSAPTPIRARSLADDRMGRRLADNIKKAIQEELDRETGSLWS